MNAIEIADILLTANVTLFTGNQFFVALKQKLPVATQLDLLCRFLFHSGEEELFSRKMLFYPGVKLL